MRFGRAAAAVLIALALLLLPASPLLALLDDSCSQMPCCRGAHAACHRSMEAPGPGLTGLPPCAQQCGQSAGTAVSIFSIEPPPPAETSAGIAASAAPSATGAAQRATDRFFTLFERPPPPQLTR